MEDHNRVDGPTRPGHGPRSQDSSASGRQWLALVSFALGGFAIGCSEFAAMGLLPQVAMDADPTQWAEAPTRAVADVSVFVWGYALGVVLGAPVFGPLSRRFGERRFIVGALTAMAAMTLITALVPWFPAVTAGRILSGLPHAAFFGVTALVAARMLGARNAARGVAVVLGGLTLANLIGAPLGTWVGQQVGWRSVYLTIAIIFAMAAAGSFHSLPRRTSHPSPGSTASAMRALLNGGLWTSIGVWALVMAGLFTVVTFTAPISTGSGVRPEHVAFVVAATGLGMVLGNHIGGRVADRSDRDATILLFGSTILGLAAFTIAPLALAAVYIGFGLLGVALGASAPFIQARLADATPSHPEVGSSMNSLCANLGSVVGGLAGSFTIVHAVDVRMPALVAVALVALGALGVVLTSARERSRARGNS